MTEQYEYERVEIKPGDNKTWQDASIYVGADKLAYTVLHVGEHCVFVSRLSSGGHYFENLYALGADFYIRKPRPKMVKKALCVLKTKGEFRPVEHYPNQEFITEEKAKELFGDELFKWPYGEIIEVPEGE